MTFEFGARTIVSEATWHIHPNERIGLIGYNGTGKSTLLKVLAGEMLPSKGSVERGRFTTIGYLHQDLLSFDTNESILQVAMHAFDKAMLIEKQLNELIEKLAKQETEELLLQYSEKLHDFEEAGGYNIQHQTEEVLQGLGFSNQDLQRPYREFSGGWRMRVLLAKMILQQPDLLLLDEPTNHLDLPSIEWLEKYLQHYKGAVVIVSHDKYFLNRMVTKIVELYQRELHIYNGNYDFYETEKEQRIELQQRAFENQQDYIRQQERFIERFKAKASKAAQAQSALKRLNKLDRIEDVELERPNIRINFSVDKTPGRVLTELKHVTKKFGDVTILENASAEIDRGDKIALIGANGKGKSTLLRIIAGTEPIEGDRKWGHNVDEAFYAQHQLEALNTNNTILEEMKEAGAQKTELELRSLLGCFLFSGDDADKKIKILSGGEKARVALAKTITSKANFLLLDEPTNHLDIHSNELLIEALNRYQGSFMLVSHDRYFIAKTANKIWEIDDHKIREFKGGYEEYVEWKERKEKETRDKNQESRNKEQGTRDKNQESRNKEQGSNNKKEDLVNDKPVHSPINKEAQKELQKQQKVFQQLEKQVNELTQMKNKLEADLASPDIYEKPELFTKTEADYKEDMQKLKITTAQYEEVFEK
ncbi:MAG: ATP-binding cassette domain-containing protein, partial [Bacteroidota bacterium]|nr:ATP-binding cassette domain-containing protein [Bacteroidota bacterium]